jgi:hypothetical protein
MMLLRLTLLQATATKVLALFPFLRLTYLLHCVFGSMRTMAKLLLVRRYLNNVRSQSTSVRRLTGLFLLLDVSILYWHYY